MVSDVTINSALNQQVSTQGATDSLAEDFSEFLTLLTIQLQNQDPLDPMDTTEFTNQLVAFTGVEQQINTNERLDSLVALNLGSAVGSAIGYVGQDISYISPEFHFDGENQAEITYALNAEAAQGTLRIRDERGTQVYEGPLAASVGQHEFTWDGRLPDGTLAPAGTYSVQIDALDAQDQAVGSSVVVHGNVRGVETQNGQIFALVGERAVSLGNVLSVNVPSPVPLVIDDGTGGDDAAGDPPPDDGGA